MPIDAALVFAGGGLGAVFRWLLSKAAFKLYGSEFPWGTLAVNLAGCLLIGLAVGAIERGLLPPRARPALVAGFLGGFTTFSTYAFGSFELMRRGDWGIALIQALASNCAGIALAAIGWAIVIKRF